MYNLYNNNEPRASDAAYERVQFEQCHHKVAEGVGLADQLPSQDRTSGKGGVVTKVSRTGSRVVPGNHLEETSHAL